MSEGISESRFKMWRAVFAMAHADGLVTDHEKSFMENYLEKVPFSPEQREILREDMRDPELLGDLAHVARRARLVNHGRGAADHFQVG